LTSPCSFFPARLSKVHPATLRATHYASFVTHPPPPSKKQIRASNRPNTQAMATPVHQVRSRDVWLAMRSKERGQERVTRRAVAAKRSKMEVRPQSVRTCLHRSSAPVPRSFHLNHHLIHRNHQARIPLMQAGAKWHLTWALAALNRAATTHPRTLPPSSARPRATTALQVNGNGRGLCARAMCTKCGARRAWACPLRA